MMIFLTSLLYTHYYDENGDRVPIALKDENGIVGNLRNNLKRRQRLVLVANDMYDSEDNDNKISVIRDSFGMSELGFNEYAVLDARNKNSAADIIAGADLIILSGGKCVCQLEFFEEIGLRDILLSYNGIVIGVSAGAMDLCGTVANFPEEVSDLTQNRWLKGLGFVDEIMIPHYDGEQNRYQFECEEFDIATDYILPMSKGKRFTAIPNGSYVMITSDGKKRYCGDVYTISDGKTVKIIDN